MALVATDLLVASTATTLVFGWLAGAAPGLIGAADGRSFDPAMRIAAAFLPLCWVLCLLFHNGYDRNPVEPGVLAGHRVVHAAATLVMIGLVACLALGQTTVVGVAVTAVALTAVLTAVSRRVVAAGLRTARGLAGPRRTLAVGHASAVAGLVSALRRDQPRQVAVVAACLGDPDGWPAPQARSTLAAQSVPVAGGLSDIVAVAVGMGCETVVVAPSAELDAARLRRLAWELHDAGIDLVVAPALAEVTPHRVTVGNLGGRLLLHVRAPRFDGPQRVAKEIVDRALAAVLLTLAAPIMLAIALAIRLTSPGPALFRQRRVGRHGTEFTCLKFRTMLVDAEAYRDEIAHLNERREGLLFKIRKDPRITTLGAWLRRASLDELPQLVNVLLGDMSLVGPRPALPAEVAAYDGDVRRRLRVKPGLTGLWQVSGRAELPWPEAVRLDLAYVDNWSLSLDAQILLRTASAVVRGVGAY